MQSKIFRNIFSFVLTICLITILFPCVQSNASTTPQIILNNFAGNETIYYEMPLFRGSIEGTADKVSVSVNNSTAINWTVHPVKKTFKAFAQLIPGVNTIKFSAQGHLDKVINITYIPKTEGPGIKYIYAYASDSTGFRAPSGTTNTINSAVKRLSLAALMIQGSWAELMNDRGYGRQTFRLERPNSTDVVFTKCLDKTVSQLHQYNSINNANHNYPYTYDDLYSYVDAQVRTDSNYIKNVVFTGDSDLQLVNGQIESYTSTALGGGDLALCGGEHIYTMPETLAGVDAALYNTTPGLAPKTDPIWKLYGTSVVASMHELGHAFGLAHLDGDRAIDWTTNQLTVNQSGIMSLGFYQGNRLFSVKDGDGTDFDFNNSVSWNKGYIENSQTIQNDCDVLSTSQWIGNSEKYKIEAESQDNTLTGSTSIVNDSFCSGLRKVTNINGSIAFNNIYSPTNLCYDLNVYYKSLQAPYTSNVYEAENGTLAGSAEITSKQICSNGSYVRMLGSGSGTDTITVNVPAAGTYNMNVYFICADTRSFWYSVNNGTGVELSNCSSGDWNTVGVKSISVTLLAGTNTISFFNQSNYCPDLDKISIDGAPLQTGYATLEAATNIYEAEGGTVAGSGEITNNPICSNGSYVRLLGSGSGTDTITVNVPAAGTYKMNVYFICADTRSFWYSINNGTSVELSNCSSGNWNTVGVKTVNVTLSAGANTIRFLNQSDYCPDLDKISITDLRLVTLPALSNPNQVGSVTINNIQLNTGSNVLRFLSGANGTTIAPDIDKIEIFRSIRVQSYNDNRNESTTQLAPCIKVTNTGNTSINLNDIKVRYYFMSENVSPLTYTADWSDKVSLSKVTSSFANVSSSGADHYLSIGFTSDAGILAAGDSIVVKGRICDGDYNQSFTQSNDYSFNVSATDYVVNSKVTGWVGGSLKWGQEP